MSLLNWVIGTGIASPMGFAKEVRFNLVMFTEVAEGHGSAMSIGSFDSSQCKSTLVRDSGPAGLGWVRGPRHDSIAQHRVTGCGIPILGWERERELMAGPRLLARRATQWEVSHNVVMSHILVVM